MATFTTFCFGTGEDKNMKLKNIISQFSESCSNDPQIFDGPGALGREVSKNTSDAIKGVTKWLLTQETNDNNLNLTGFSRGAVTCIRIANELKKLEFSLADQGDKLEESDQKLLSKLQG